MQGGRGSPHSTCLSMPKPGYAVVTRIALLTSATCSPPERGAWAWAGVAGETCGARLLFGWRITSAALRARARVHVALVHDEAPPAEHDLRAGRAGLAEALSRSPRAYPGAFCPASPHETRLRIPATEPWLNSTISPSALLTFTS